MKYAIHSNTGGPKDYHSKWRKSERERQISCDTTCMCNLKKELIYKTNRLTDLESKLMAAKWEKWGGGIDRLGAWD